MNNECITYASSFTFKRIRGRRSRDHMVVGFTTTYVIGAYHHWCCGFDSHSGQGIQHYMIKFVSPPELEIKETTDSALSTSFLDLYLEFDDSGQLSTKIYDKRDDFNFKIINFPNMCSNIPASPAYGFYISQLIRYARASSNHSDFLKHHFYLRNRLLDQGYKKIRLMRSLKKFIFRYQDLVEKYSVSAEMIINDGFS